MFKVYRQILYPKIQLILKIELKNIHVSFDRDAVHVTTEQGSSSSDHEMLDPVRTSVDLRQHNE